MGERPTQPVFETAALSEPQTVLVVDDDAATLDRIRSTMADQNGRQLRTESTISDAVDRLEGVDAVVSDTALSDERGTDLLQRVRERYPTLPFVFYTSEARTDVAETVTDDEWATVVEKDDSEATVRFLNDAVTRLVDFHRSAALAGHALTAIEIARDGIALVGPDDQFQFVNQAFASQFGYEPDDLYGRDWRVCYPSKEVDRLERTALESVAEGWLWTGGCRGVDADGEEVTVRTRITGLDDDSIVFVLCEAPTQE